MATKQQVERALEKACSGATLYVIDGYADFQAQLTAPYGYHWDDGLHCIHLDVWFKGGWKRSEYWQMVLETINKGLPDIELCSNTSKCDEMVLHKTLECPWWNEGIEDD